MKLTAFNRRAEPPKPGDDEPTKQATMRAMLNIDELSAIALVNLRDQHLNRECLASGHVKRVGAQKLQGEDVPELAVL